MHFSDGRKGFYKQLFYVTDCDRSPNLLSKDACYTLGVLKPCYTVERAPSTQHLAHKCDIWVSHAQNRHLIKAVVGNCLMIPGNSQFDRIS